MCGKWDSHSQVDIGGTVEIQSENRCKSPMQFGRTVRARAGVWVVNHARLPTLACVVR